MGIWVMPLFLIVAYILIRCGDVAISASIARDTIRAIIYGILAALALLACIFAIFGIH